MRKLLILIVLICSGCVHNQMKSWLGKPENLLVQRWGAPMKFYEVNDNKILSWMYPKGYRMCTKSFTIKNEIVIAYSYNGC